MLALVAVVVLCFVNISIAFVPNPSRLLKYVSMDRDSLVAVSAINSDKSTLGSKLLPSFTEEEMSDIFKEFNITNFDVNNDPEIKKWEPSKEFFEKFGFQNNTERYKRKTMDVKMDFYSRYTKPILPQYKTFIADIMAMSFVQTVDSRYKYDALHAFGICTQYYTIMKGYALTDEVSEMICISYLWSSFCFFVFQVAVVRFIVIFAFLMFF